MAFLLVHPSFNCRKDADALEAEMKEATKSQHEEMNYSKLQLAALREDRDGLKWGWPPNNIPQGDNKKTATQPLNHVS